MVLGEGQARDCGLPIISQLGVLQPISTIENLVLSPSIHAWIEQSCTDEMTGRADLSGRGLRYRYRFTIGTKI